MIRLNKILLPTDFSESSAPPTRYAVELARKFDAELHLLHVIEEPVMYMPAFGGYVPDRDEFEAYAEAGLQNCVPEDQAAGLHIERRKAFGSPFLRIVEDARDNDIDLVVIGSHGRSAIPHLLMGSVAENVVRKAPCPVLTVRPEQHQFVMP